MSKAIKRIIGTVLTVVLTLVFIAGLTELTAAKGPVISKKEFFEAPEKYDVLFFGTSHVMQGIYPYFMWRENGISAYNLANGGNRIAIEYWQMINALDYADPSLIVLDGFNLCDEYLNTTNMGFLHNQLDVYPLSVNKLKAINDLWKGTYHFTKDQKHEAVWPFMLYHNRWDEIGKEDFVVEYEKQGGAELFGIWSEPGEVRYSGECAEVTEDTVAVPYLIKFIEECRERNIPLLLTYLPFPATEESFMEANLVGKIAEEYGVNYINFLNLDVVDFEIDCMDKDSHVNVSGSRKISEYLSNYIAEEYGIPDRRPGNRVDSNSAEYSTHYEIIADILSEQTKIKNYLVTLSGCDTPAIVRIKTASKIRSDEILAKLVENLLAKGELKEFGDAENNYLAVIDNCGNTVWENPQDKIVLSNGAELAYGTHSQLTINGEESDICSRDADISIILLRPDGTVDEELSRDFYID